MHYQIHGEQAQTLEITLQQNESLFSKQAQLTWYTGDVDISVNTRQGLVRGIPRSLAGGTLFFTTYTCKSKRAVLRFCTETAVNIHPLYLSPTDIRICQQESFLVSQNSNNLETFLRTKIDISPFQQNDFTLQKTSGPGTIWLAIAGDLHEQSLEAGEKIRVLPHHIAMYETSVNFEINRTSNVKEMLLSKKTPNYAILTGPGTIWLQTQSIFSLSARLSQLKTNRSE